MTAIDRQALRELVDAYALAVDHADGAAVAALFTSDGVLATWMDPASGESTGERIGREKIQAAVDGVARYHATHHTISATRSVIDGDRATGETTCEAHHVEGSPPDARDRVLHIRYTDTFARTDDGWRFTRREVRVRWVAILPVG